MVLNSDEIKYLIGNKKMVTDYIDIDKQLQPTGFDLTVEKIYEANKHFLGSVGFDDKFIPPEHEVRPIQTDEGYCWYLDSEKTYKFKINETIKLPYDVCAMSIQRSSLMRSYVDTNIGWWDTGYHGSGYSFITVYHPNGYKVYKNARILNMVFFRNKAVKGYTGSYQRENVK